MRASLLPALRAGGAVLALAALGAGCAAPDRWGVFESRVPDSADPAGDRTVEIPRALHPGAPEITAVETPDGEKVVEFTIEQAVMRALDANRDLQVEQLGPVIAGTFENIERGVYDAELFAEAEYFREKANETSRATGEQFSVEGDDRDIVFGIRQPLPSGTAVRATVEHSRSTSDRAPDQQEARVGLTVTQALLQGRAPEVNLARVRQAQLEGLASVHELRAFTEALLADVEIAYWNFVLAYGEIEIVERSLEVARQQRSDVEEQIEVGLLPEIEAAAVRAEVARREQALILAQSLREERRLRLLKLLGQDPDGAFSPALRPVTDPRIEPEPVTDLEDRILLAERSRPDLAESRLRLEQERLETMITRNGLLPKLDLFIALGGTGYAEAFFSSIGEIGEGTYDISAGVRLSQFLGNRAARARDLAARASRRQAAEAVRNLEQIVRFDVRLAANSVESARRQIAASEATRLFQEQSLAAEQERFAVGAGTALLVAQAQRDLLASQIAEIRSIVNYRIARTELYRAEGSLLERRGIRLATADDFRSTSAD